MSRSAPTMINVGLIINNTFIPMVYECASGYLRRYLACINQDVSFAHCTKEAEVACPVGKNRISSPGPGVIVEIFAYMAAYLKRSHSDTTFHLHEVAWGTDVTSWNDAVEHITNGSIDIWVDAFRITEERVKLGAGFTIPVFSCPHGFVTHYKNLFSESSSLHIHSLLAPFGPTTWIVLLFSFLACGAVFGLFQNAKHRVEKHQQEHPACSGLYGMWSSFTYFASNSLTAEVSRCRLEWRSFMWLATLWTLAAFLLQQLYSSVITTKLMLPTKSSPMFRSSTELGELILTEDYRLIDGANYLENYEHFLSTSVERQTGLRRMQQVLHEHPIIQRTQREAFYFALQHRKHVVLTSKIQLSAVSLQQWGRNRTYFEKLRWQDDDDLPPVWCAFIVNAKKTRFLEFLSNMILFDKPVVNLIKARYHMQSDDGTTAGEVNLDEAADDRMIISTEDSMGLFVLTLLAFGVSTVVFAAEKSVKNWGKKVVWVGQKKFFPCKNAVSAANLESIIVVEGKSFLAKRAN